MSLKEVNEDGCSEERKWGACASENAGEFQDARAGWSISGGAMAALATGAIEVITTTKEVMRVVIKVVASGGEREGRVRV